MPHTDVQPYYALKLTSDEFRLVVLGLSGMLKDEEDVMDALTLNTHLCSQRANGLKQALEVASKALENASRLENPNVPPMKPK